MTRERPSFGMILAKLRYDRGLTQDEAVALMNNAGYYMTRDILVNIETGRGVAKHTYIEAFIVGYQIEANPLFPPEILLGKHKNVGLEKEGLTRRLNEEKICFTPDDCKETVASIAKVNGPARRSG